MHPPLASLMVNRQRLLGRAAPPPRLLSEQPINNPRVNLDIVVLQVLVRPELGLVAGARVAQNRHDPAALGHRLGEPDGRNEVARARRAEEQAVVLDEVARHGDGFFVRDPGSSACTQSRE